ncbi:hypothetical protein IQ07DRAFT_374954 [Pyrenochaeta sp. DS3sAY3a]|nr:hypothetical protein IQ07DRAFT_374954 [Pyrenochaeta sp. DS3sAY3a]
MKLKTFLILTCPRRERNHVEAFTQPCGRAAAPPSVPSAHGATPSPSPTQTSAKPPTAKSRSEPCPICAIGQSAHAFLPLCETGTARDAVTTRTPGTDALQTARKAIGVSSCVGLLVELRCWSLLARSDRLASLGGVGTARTLI